MGYHLVTRPITGAVAAAAVKRLQANVTPATMFANSFYDCTATTDTITASDIARLTDFADTTFPESDEDPRSEARRWLDERVEEVRVLAWQT